MEKNITMMAMLLSMATLGWTGVDDFEVEACVALTNSQYLMSVDYTNKLSRALASDNLELRLDARIVLAASEYQRFLDEADVSGLNGEFNQLSNVVIQTSGLTNLWQHWTSRLLYAGSFASHDAYVHSYAMLTNLLERASRSDAVETTNRLHTALLKHYELSDLSTTNAVKVMAAMSAGELGMGNVMTNLANQVPLNYRNIILDHFKSEH